MSWLLELWDWLHITCDSRWPYLASHIKLHIPYRTPLIGLLVEHKHFSDALNVVQFQCSFVIH